MCHGAAGACRLLGTAAARPYHDDTLGSSSKAHSLALLALAPVVIALGAEGCGSTLVRAARVDAGVGGVAPGSDNDGGWLDTATTDGGHVPTAADGGALLEAGRTEDGSVSESAEAGRIAGGIRYLGRVDATDPGAVKFAWSGSGLVATVAGSKISVRLRTEGTSTAFFQAVIDGRSGPRFQVMTGSLQTVVLADGLGLGDHTIELYRESEGMYGDTVFSGFVDGTVRGAPAASGRLIEIVGDSISAGYGNLGAEIHPPWDNACTFSLDTESAYQAYGSILARGLNAEVSIIARSGWGMYRDLGGSTTGVLPSIYDHTLGTQPSPAWTFVRQADAVVINLGTNDAGLGDPGMPYEDAYVAFLHRLRGHYPSAWILLTIGPMTSDPLLSQMRAHIGNVVGRLADAKVVAVDIPTQDARSTGCDYHPNVAEDTTMAAVLGAAIKANLGW